MDRHYELLAEHALKFLNATIPQHRHDDSNGEILSRLFCNSPRWCNTLRSHYQDTQHAT